MKEQGERDLGWLCLMARRDLVERSQDPEAPRIEVGLGAAAARALGEVRFAAVLAGRNPFARLKSVMTPISCAGTIGEPPSKPRRS